MDDDHLGVPVAAAAGDDVLGPVERWFLARGLPHFIERRDTILGIWGRALPLLVVAYGLVGLNALDLLRWTWRENLAAAVCVVLVLLATWAGANLLRRRPPFTRPRQVGRGELAVFFIGPAIPAALFGQWGDVAQVFVTAAITLAVIYVVTSYGVIPMLGWAGRRAVGQLAVLGNLVVRALPLLLLFTTFLFINAEVWQVAGTLHGGVYVAVLLIFFALGAVFVLSRVPATMRELSSFASWSEIRELVVDTPGDALALPDHGSPPPHRLTKRQKFNIGLVTVFSQALQITLVAVVLCGFFVVFGVLAIPESTTAGWTALDDVHVIASFGSGSRPLVLTEPLLRVAAFLGAFSGMYFTVVLSTDDTYRREFAEDVAPEMRTALAVSEAYRFARRSIQ